VRAFIFSNVDDDNRIDFAVTERTIFRHQLEEKHEEGIQLGASMQERTSIVYIAKEKTSVSRVNGSLSSSSVKKTSGACQRAGPTTFVVVNVVVLKTGTKPKSTKRGLPFSISTLHYRSKSC